MTNTTSNCISAEQIEKLKKVKAALEQSTAHTDMPRRQPQETAKKTERNDESVIDDGTFEVIVQPGPIYTLDKILDRLEDDPELTHKQFLVDIYGVAKVECTDTDPATNGSDQFKELVLYGRYKTAAFIKTTPDGNFPLKMDRVRSPYSGKVTWEIDYNKNYFVNEVTTAHGLQMYGDDLVRLYKFFLELEKCQDYGKVRLQSWVENSADWYDIQRDRKMSYSDKRKALAANNAAKRDLWECITGGVAAQYRRAGRSFQAAEGTTRFLPDRKCPFWHPNYQPCYGSVNVYHAQGQPGEGWDQLGSQPIAELSYQTEYHTKLVEAALKMANGEEKDEPATDELAEFLASAD